jgi:hypothetical protein
MLQRDGDGKKVLHVKSYRRRVAVFLGTSETRARRGASKIGEVDELSHAFESL